MKVLCIGDIVARPGREALQRKLEEVKKDHGIDLTVVNGENSAGGSGIDKKCYREIKDAGADVITLGDHTWRRPEVRQILSGDSKDCICPGNYPEPEWVQGWCKVERAGALIGVLNVIGRTFIQSALDCPFRYAEGVLQEHLNDCSIVIVDFHGEATSEKVAFGKYFDGKVSLVFGTHTHVQTADERVLPNGTAYITDLGMTGSQAGVIGLDREVAIKRFLTGIPSTYKPASGDVMINGIVAEFSDELSPDGKRKALSIQRVAVSC